MNEALNSGGPVPVRDERSYIDNAPEPKEYRRPKQDLLREYELSIRFLSVGCVVRVGCKEIPFESVDRAMQEVDDYVRDPYASTEKWSKIFNQ